MLGQAYSTNSWRTLDSININDDLKQQDMKDRAFEKWMACVCWLAAAIKASTVLYWIDLYCRSQWRTIDTLIKSQRLQIYWAIIIMIAGHIKEAISTGRTGITLTRRRKVTMNHHVWPVVRQVLHKVAKIIHATAAVQRDIALSVLKLCSHNKTI